MTYQHIYYSEVYADYLTRIKRIEKIELQTIEEWSELINDNPHQQLVSFSDSNSGNTNNEVEMIINLIKIRNHIIGLILEKLQKK